MGSKGYSPEWLEELKNKNDIVSVISSYIKLEKKGKNFWGCCPFHHERTPSFCVNEYDGFYHCFGCGESGDVISFVRKYEGIDFVDAVKILADKVDMKIPTFAGDEEVAKRKKEKELTLKVLNIAKNHYKDNLLKPEAKPAQDYIKKRGLGGREVRDFELGYAIGWSELVLYLKGLGFSHEELLLSKIIETKNGRDFDPFANRLIFPIINTFGDCIGFSARILEKSDFAKYKNSAQSIVFDKSNVVYGINIIKQLKNQGSLDSIIIVEGQMDVIAMHKAGFKNAVACMGTALTPLHAKQLKRYVDKVYVCFDGDGAGQKATMRSLDILKEAGLDVFVLSLPDGNDPDEIIKMFGVEKMQELLHSALPATDFKLKHIECNFDLNLPSEKAKYLKEALSIVSSLETNSEKETYLTEVRKKTNIPIDVLRKDLKNDDAQQKFESEVNLNSFDRSQNAQIKALQFVVASNLFEKDWADYDNEILTCISNKSVRLLLSKILSKHNLGEKYSAGSIFDEFDVDNEFQIKQIINFDFSKIGDSSHKYYIDCKNLLKIEQLKQEQQNCLVQYKSEKNDSKRKELAQRIAEIAKQLKNKN